MFMRIRMVGLLCGALLGVARHVSAQVTEPPTPSAAATRAEPATSPEASQGEPSEIEIGAVPLAGGDTDVGVGVGFLGSIVRAAPRERVPYEWRLESGAFVSFKSGADESLEIPYFQGYLAFTEPRLWEGRLRVDLRLEHVSEANLRYFGIGNASVRPKGDDAERDLHARIRPTLWARGRLQLPHATFVGLGAALSQNWMRVGANSKLAFDLANGSPELRGWLRGTQDHGVLLLEGSLGLDTRDNDISPQAGQFHRLTLRVSPAAGANFPHAYQQLNAAVAFYRPILSERLVGVAWSTFDALLGAPPFYELARFDETFAIGGNQGVRGVPGQRYYGKVKAMGSAELRTRITSFQAFHDRWSIGLATFADTGRLWTDFRSRPELDGSGLGLKYGLGAGIRLQQGSAFVVRADVAWSPDARPVGAYVLAGHAH
jgi:hypothetical protein